MKLSRLCATALAIVAMAATVGYAAKNPIVGGKEMFPNKNIVENAVNSADHTTLVAAVKAAGLVDTLMSPGPFTVFAPTNAAFAKLPAGTVDTLLKPENKGTLTKVLTYHVVPGRVSSADLKKMIKKEKGTATLKTVSGGMLWATMQGQRHRAEGREGRLVEGHAGQRLPVQRRHSRRRQRRPSELGAWQVIVNSADEEHFGTLGGRDFTVVRILIGVMKVTRAQHTAVDHDRSLQDVALLRPRVTMRGIDRSRVGLQRHRHHSACAIDSKDPHPDARQARLDPLRRLRPHGIAAGSCDGGEHAIAHAWRRIDLRHAGGERDGRVVEPRDFLPRAGRQGGDERLELALFVGVERADRIGKGQRFDVLGNHAECSSCTRSDVRPARMRVLTVPSGRPSLAASS